MISNAKKKFVGGKNEKIKYVLFLFLVSVILITLSTFYIKASNNMGKKIVYIDTGGNQNLAVTENGELYEWELGGKLESRYLPTKVMEHVKIAKAGWAHVLAIDQSGNLYCWGNNEYGQLGDGTKESKTTPVKVLENVIAIAAGNYHSLAVTKNGDLYAWGYNDCGQLGNGTRVDSNKPIKIMTNVKDVAAGWYTSFAITKNGDLYGWGANDSNLLCSGRSEYRSKPVKIMSEVQKISAGLNHALVLTKKGELYVLGYGSEKPLKVNLKDIKGVSHIYAGVSGDSYSLVVDKNGVLWAWGRGYNETVIIKNEVKQSKIYKIIEFKPVKIMSNVMLASGKLAMTKDKKLYIFCNNTGPFIFGAPERVDRPVLIMKNVSLCSAGADHSLALTKDGKLYGWGNNSYNQLGNGTKNPLCRPTKIDINVGEIIGILAGTQRSFLINKKGELFGWGSNTNNTIDFSNDKIISKPKIVLKGITQVDTNENETFVVTKNGKMYALVFVVQAERDTLKWQIIKENRQKMYNITNNVDKISAGYQTLILKKDGTLYALKGKTSWKGSHTQIESYVIEKVLNNVVSMASGYDHCLAVTKDGSLYAWGNDPAHGEIGNGVAIPNLRIDKPVKVMDNVKMVTAGANRSFALTKDGEVYAWGFNLGTLGTGTDSWYEPKPVKVFEGAVWISCKGGHVLALTKEGDLYGWGDNSSGQVGIGGIIISKPTQIIIR